jgi:transcriptional regulator with XRE-family HTH domain
VEGDLQQAIGRNLRAYREDKGLSQEAFADALGVHRTYMGGIERGERNLTLKSLERIAARIGVEPLALLEASEREPGPASLAAAQLDRSAQPAVASRRP